MEISLVFPHQLWEQHPALQTDRPVFLVEEFLFFRQYSFHKQKLVLHRASMKYYESLLNSSRYVVTYVHSTENHSDIRQLIPFLATAGIRIIHVADVVDDWLERRLVSAAHKNGIQIKWYSNPGFLLTKEDLKTLPEQPSYLQASFYQWQRKRLRVLIDEQQKPIGGKWSFDADNRSRYPSGERPPTVHFPGIQSWVIEAKEYVANHYGNNPGSMDSFIYPVTHADAFAWLTDFLNNRFSDFGRYEDAIVQNELILHHSLLSPLLNIGLLKPATVLNALLQYAQMQSVPLAS
ncbi:MAG TPA: cryptochrome/photolyase family protein, partial [Ferruginibacter sp.]|nr:cryptochrome/photolyase family protein [Ferruginibacter sp.]